MAKHENASHAFNMEFLKKVITFTHVDIKYTNLV